MKNSIFKLPHRIKANYIWFHIQAPSVDCGNIKVPSQFLAFNNKPAVNIGKTKLEVNIGKAKLEVNIDHNKLEVNIGKEVNIDKTKLEVNIDKTKLEVNIG